jgi:hypothetical protein
MVTLSCLLPLIAYLKEIFFSFDILIFLAFLFFFAFVPGGRSHLATQSWESKENLLEVAPLSAREVRSSRVLMVDGGWKKYRLCGV